jgi:hypothetical protein
MALMQLVLGVGVASCRTASLSSSGYKGLPQRMAVHGTAVHSNVLCRTHPVHQITGHAPKTLACKGKTTGAERIDRSVLSSVCRWFCACRVQFPFWLVSHAQRSCDSGIHSFAHRLWAEVMRENAYLSRTVEIQENHKVVDTGIVRHPMYAAALLLFLSIPLVLGSVISFVW